MDDTQMVATGRNQRYDEDSSNNLLPSGLGKPVEEQVSHCLLSTAYCLTDNHGFIYAVVS